VFIVVRKTDEQRLYTWDEAVEAKNRMRREREGEKASRRGRKGNEDAENGKESRETNFG